MDKFFTLYKVNLSSLFGLNKKLYGKKGLLKGLLGLLALVVLIAGISAFYAWTFADMEEDVASLFIYFAAVATFMFSFYATSSQLFGTQDYHLLASMPIKKHQVVFAKLASIVTANAIISLLIVVPAMFVQQEIYQNIYLVDGVRYIICALFTCFMPIALSTFVGAFFTLITARLKRKNLILTILYLALFVAFYFVPETYNANLIDFIEKIYFLSLDEGRDELIKIKGVGEKVAQCSLLYGFGKIDAFPVDVWVKRIMSELYPDGLPECTNGVRGIAQQYLFHWRRNFY